MSENQVSADYSGYRGSKTNPRNTKSKLGHIFVIYHGWNVQFNVSTKSQLLLHVKNSLATENTCDLILLLLGRGRSISMHSDSILATTNHLQALFIKIHIYND